MKKWCFRSDESAGSPSSSIAGTSNDSSGIPERSSIKWDNLNNNAALYHSNTNANLQNGLVLNNSQSAQQQPIPIANNNNVGIYSGGSSLSGDNMSIGSITDIPGINILLTFYVFYFVK